MTNSFTEIVNDTLAKNINVIICHPWGFSFAVSDELTAHRLVYAYRHNKNLNKIEFNEVAGTYLVTIFNDQAKAMGCDC